MNCDNLRPSPPSDLLDVLRRFGLQEVHLVHCAQPADEPVGTDMPSGRVPFDQLTAREVAAIQLCVPSSGTDWLDRMIEEAAVQRAASQILASLANAEGLGKLGALETVNMVDKAMVLARTAVQWGEG